MRSRNVTVEVNTVFQNVVAVLDQIDPAKLNARCPRSPKVSAAKASGSARRPPTPTRFCWQLNPRNETIRADLRALKNFNDTYERCGARHPGDARRAEHHQRHHHQPCQATGCTAAGHHRAFQRGISLLAPNQANLIKAINVLEPTTNLLHKYDPEYTCLLLGAKSLLDNGRLRSARRQRENTDVGRGLTLGDDPYRYPDNLPVVGAKGGPGGKPGCGSLPDRRQNWPVRNLVTNTGFGTGMDWRPNPGIGFPAWANYFPVTRAVPEPPSIRNLFGGPAPGPIPYPGAPPYGADLYAPDGTPLWPGLPPAPPPGRPRDPGPTPGSEPFVVPAPAQMQPTPLPPVPPPREAAPSP